MVRSSKGYSHIHLKTIWNPDVFSIFQMFLLPDFRYHLKSRLYASQPFTWTIWNRMRLDFRSLLHFCTIQIKSFAACLDLDRACLIFFTDLAHIQSSLRSFDRHFEVGRLLGPGLEVSGTLFTSLQRFLSCCKVKWHLETGLPEDLGLWQNVKWRSGKKRDIFNDVTETCVKEKKTCKG